jgi:hypothetical protein
MVVHMLELEAILSFFFHGGVGPGVEGGPEVPGLRLGVSASGPELLLSEGACRFSGRP